ncbi:MAG: hypothetical protein KGL35_00910 [Bradyrhizobium sp.]|nr:hypothetical protein [Bradyrhizobium sp.]
MIDDCTNRSHVLRGSDLPQSKLDDGDVRLIRAAVVERDRLKREASSLSNCSLARKFGVHTRTIEKIVQGESWVHVP